MVGYKVIRTEHYGIFLLMKPEISGDGIEEIKSVTGYSLEKKLENKQFFLEEGTFNFWNPATPDDTILGRILEVSPGWKAGYVDENGNLHVKNLSAFWIPELTTTEKVGHTTYTVTGSYEGKESFLKKLERIVAKNAQQKFEDEGADE